MSLFMSNPLPGSNNNKTRNNFRKDTFDPKQGSNFLITDPFNNKQSPDWYRYLPNESPTRKSGMPQEDASGATDVPPFVQFMHNAQSLQRQEALHAAEQRRLANIMRTRELRETIADTPALTNQELRIRARKKIAPIFRPQIRQTKRSIRQTERQGRIAANQVQGYYEQAGQKVSGIAKSSRKTNRRAIKQTMSGGIQGSKTADKQSGIAARAMKGMGKANASFFKQMQAALAGEGAVAAADTRRNYKDLANTYREDLAALRAEKAAREQQVMQSIRSGINRTARKVYEDSYLSLIQQGIPARKAQQAALAQAGTYGQQIEARAARMILKNKGNEKLLAGMQKKKGLTEEQWDRKMDRRQLNLDTQKAGNDQLAKLAEIAEGTSNEDLRKAIEAIIMQQVGGGRQ